MSLATSKPLLSTIHYPAAVKKQPLLPPVSTAESRALVAEFKKATQGKKNELRRFVMTEDEKAKPDREGLVKAGVWSPSLHCNV